MVTIPTSEPPLSGPKLESLICIDMSKLSQSELYALSLCSDSVFDLRSSDDVISPQIDHALFNESAGSRRQTYSRLRLAPRPPDSSTAASHRSHLPGLLPHPRLPFSLAPDDPERVENKSIVNLLKQLITSNEFQNSPTERLLLQSPPPQPVVCRNAEAVGPPINVDTQVRSASQDMQLVLYTGERNRKRGRKSKEKFPEDVGEIQLEIVNKNGVVVDFKALEENADDLYGDEFRRRSVGLETEEEVLGVLTNLEGQWGSRRKRRKMVDASDFGDALPVGWKLLLALRRREGRVSIYCRRYISPNGQQFVSCKEASLFLQSYFGLSDTRQQVNQTGCNNQQHTGYINENDVVKQDTVLNSALTSLSENNEQMELSLIGIDNLPEVQVRDLFECHVCNMSFDEKNVYLEHLMSFHQKTTRRYKIGSSIGEGVIVKDGSYECQICHKVFQERRSYNGHVGVHVRNHVRSSENLPGQATIQKSTEPPSQDGLLTRISKMDALIEIAQSSILETPTDEHNEKANDGSSPNTLEVVTIPETHAANTNRGLTLGSDPNELEMEECMTKSTQDQGFNQHDGRSMDCNEGANNGSSPNTLEVVDIADSHAANDHEITLSSDPNELEMEDCMTKSAPDQGFNQHDGWSTDERIERTNDGSTPNTLEVMTIPETRATNADHELASGSDPSELEMEHCMTKSTPDQRFNQHDGRSTDEHNESANDGSSSNTSGVMTTPETHAANADHELTLGSDPNELEMEECMTKSTPDEGFNQHDGRSTDEHNDRANDGSSPNTLEVVTVPETHAADDHEFTLSSDPNELEMEDCMAKSNPDQGFNHHDVRSTDEHNERANDCSSPDTLGVMTIPETHAANADHELTSGSDSTELEMEECITKSTPNQGFNQHYGRSTDEDNERANDGSSPNTPEVVTIPETHDANADNEFTLGSDPNKLEMEDCMTKSTTEQGLNQHDGRSTDGHNERANDVSSSNTLEVVTIPETHAANTDHELTLGSAPNELEMEDCRTKSTPNQGFNQHYGRSTDEHNERANDGSSPNTLEVVTIPETRAANADHELTLGSDPNEFEREDCMTMGTRDQGVTQHDGRCENFKSGHIPLPESNLAVVCTSTFEHPKHEGDEVGKSVSSEHEIGFGNSQLTSPRNVLAGTSGETVKENVLHCGVAESTMPMVQSFQCFSSFNSISNQGENDFCTLDQKLDTLTGYDELRLDDIEPLKFSFVNEQESPALELVSTDMENDGMVEGFDPSGGFGSEPVLLSIAGRHHFTTVCVWCRAEFNQEAFDFESESDSVGFMCPACKARISGQLNVLDGGLSRNFHF